MRIWKNLGNIIVPHDITHDNQVPHSEVMQHSTDNSERVFSETGDVSLDILRSVFGHNQFKGKQEEAVKTILQKDCVVLMPTGGGKTVCYAVPAWF